MIIFFMAITTFGAIATVPFANKLFSRKEKTQNRIVYYASVSWYGKKFHGRKMANGEIYNMYNPLVVAHKTLPFKTLVKMTNPLNGKITFLVVKDRGPYIPGRHFDLSYAAAKKLGIVEKGIEMVKIEIMTDSEFYFYRIKKGETLWRLFGHKWPKIAKINNLNHENIKRGQKIIVPYKL